MLVKPLRPDKTGSERLALAGATVWLLFSWPSSGDWQHLRSKRDRGSLHIVGVQDLCWKNLKHIEGQALTYVARAYLETM